MSRVIILDAKVYDVDYANSPSTHGGPVAPIVARLEALEDVVEVKRSNLFSLQTGILPDDTGTIVIIVEMALRYENVNKYLREHYMYLVEFHRNSRSEWPGVDARQYTDDDDLVRQIEAL